MAGCRSAAAAGRRRPPTAAAPLLRPPAPGQSANRATALPFPPPPATRAPHDPQTFLDKGMVAERVLQVIKNFEKVEPSKVTEKATFKDDLGLDSLDAVEVVMAIEEEFAIEIPDAEADAITSVEEAINFISTSPMAK